ncbi:MAG TPA: hypothetical protein ENG56_01225, partial [Candidatus Aenigmarchaeota archaeon]|nr:hypothetical protein [Candidatus Aenigmarchaeota archaeon]
MSSAPIERRISYVGDRLRVSKCELCGEEYFGVRDFCGICGRESLGKIQSLDLFFEEGELEVCTAVDEPTKKFKKFGKFLYGIVSFHEGKIKLPGRLTDIVLEGKVEPSELEGRKVVPRFRRRYAVGRREIIPTISLTFTFSDEYYP